MAAKRPARDPKFKSTAGTRETYDLTPEEREAITLDQVELTYQAAFVLNEILQHKVMEEIGDLYNALEVLKLDVSLKYEGIRKKKMARWVERIKKAGGSHAR